MVAAAREAFYLKQLLEDFIIQQKYPIEIWEDSQKCIKLSQNRVMDERSELFEKKFNFIRNKTAEGIILIH